MKVEDSQLRAESSSSLKSFGDASSVLYDNESHEVFDDSGYSSTDLKKRAL
ncbi:hypothetical protein KIN20_025718 [Parelaphostrongylus tenuis]|uniref:Uncharacterized protein n=1 Tax=Parelaphostrongylus tenuis TaxID=148309 RepID=A0AAD5QWS6_PARTN|nr:hypothetical protein KIN20_025718 [Parelaphostrongylus tenuis]